MGNHSVYIAMCITHVDTNNHFDFINQCTQQNVFFLIILSFLKFNKKLNKLQSSLEKNNHKTVKKLSLIIIVNRA